MTVSLKEQIIEALTAKPGQKAQDLARLLDVDKAEINKQLYGPLKGIAEQDRAYKWSLAANVGWATSSSTTEDTRFANTELSKICRYYLACLGFDDTGVSTFLTSKFGDPDYIEIDALPQSADDLSSSDRARKMLGRKRTEQGRYGLYFGYPTHIAHIRSKKSSWEGFMVEPFFLFPMEQDSSGQLTVDLSYPIINQKPFQTFTNAERDMLMSELVLLEQELGITGEEERIELDELAMRLQAIRPEWPWKENIDPSALGDDREPMTEINQPGIYNRAVILMAEKSPFTQGLEKELRDLAGLSRDSYRHTALGRWIHADEQISEELLPPPQPLLEVLPMNLEQRQAVSAALTRPVTIITGPPGTGKSQVVTNLLVNAAWQGKRVLFASKNNKAVDVVETRVNALGSRPILLRVGGQAHQVKLAEYVLSLLSSTTSVTEREDFNHSKKLHEQLLAKYDSLQKETVRLIDLRNKVDRLEQSVEATRGILGAQLFNSSVNYNMQEARQLLSRIEESIFRADKNKAGFFLKLLWPLFRTDKLNTLASALDSARASFKSAGIDLPPAPQLDSEMPGFTNVTAEIKQRLGLIEDATSYLNGLKELQAHRSLEEISKEENEIQKRIAEHSNTLWSLWLRLIPSSLSASERQRLGKYIAILRMIVDAGDQSQLAKPIFAKYSEMLRTISHLMPCWAVTSLSARGRIPFQAGNFDIVIFDEASQCDIASTLPLLYRAKSVVIIGDAKQLGHISGLQKGQDQALLDRHGLLEDFPHWAYSHQSLFGLGSTQVAGNNVISLVDHHRSHSDIISFSNVEFYEHKLRVATSYDNLKSPNRKEPGIRWIDAKGKTVRPVSGGAVNTSEVSAVVEALRDMVLNKQYKGSIGVVTPFRAQANLITDAVNKDEKLSTALARQGFLADTVHKFQGDERDVMFFSPVLSAGMPSGALGFLTSNGNLFNVAITRARAQLVVVGDLAACASSSVGYLSRFAKYSAALVDNDNQAQDIQLGDLGASYPKVARPELVSDWERQFYVAAYAAGLRLIPQYPVEKYILDFLCIDGDRRLAIEIDGERFHRNWTGELCRRDQIRNQRLIELGYDVMRFWVYEVRDDIDGCIDKIKAWKSPDIKS